MWRKGKPLILLVEMQTGTATPKNSMEVLQKVKNRATLWSINYTTRYLSKGYKHSDSKGHMYPSMLRVALLTIAKLLTQPKCLSIDEWIKRMWYIYIYNGILLSYQKEWKLAICDNMDGARVYYAKPNESAREIEISYDFTMWNLRHIWT